MFLRLLILSLFFFSCSKQVERGKLLSDTNSENNVSENPKRNYENYCSGRHGSDLQRFVNKQWKYGKSWLAVRKAIAEGYPNDGMPAFAETFSELELNALTDFILEEVENPKWLEEANREAKSFDGIIKSEDQDFRLQLIVEVGEVPWGIAILPNQNVLVTERSAKLFLVELNDEGKQSRIIEIEGLPKIKAAGQGGLMDLIISPNFSENQTVFFSYSKPHPDKPNLTTTAVAKAELLDNKLVNLQDIFIAEPYLTTRHHYGSRLAFDDNALLYISVGDRGRRDEFPQKLSNDFGKIHRINTDGSIPDDNPFVFLGERSSIFSFGHRNPQGLLWDSQMGLVEHEHGPRGGDELNYLIKEKNYGWPLISYGINYSGSKFTDLTEAEGLEQPIHYWVPSIAPSGMALVNSDKYPNWKGDIFIGSLRFKYLHRLKMTDGKVQKEERLLQGIGRLRDVKMDKEGYLYLAVENPGRVYKILPE